MNAFFCIELFQGDSARVKLIIVILYKRIFY